MTTSFERTVVVSLSLSQQFWRKKKLIWSCRRWRLIKLEMIQHCIANAAAAADAKTTTIARER